MRGFLEDIPVTELARADRDRAAAILGRAFEHDDMWCMLLPDAASRGRALPIMWRAVVAYCQTYGVVHSTPEIEGVACWAAPGRERVTLWRALRTGGLFMRFVSELPKDPRRNLLSALQWMDRRHRETMPATHWYLWALGVAPELQGEGIGGRLVERQLAVADASRTQCYLETQSVRNAGFYERRGFRTVAEDDVPGFDVHLWLMRRDPRPPAATS